LVHEVPKILVNINTYINCAKVDDCAMVKGLKNPPPKYSKTEIGSFLSRGIE
jgi:hypothetical protein